MIFRRKGKNDEPETAARDASTRRGTDVRAEGPFDSTEVDADDLEAEDRIDLGALV